MDKRQLKDAVAAAHAAGRRVAVSFCAHVPEEILEAAGFCSLRVYHVEGEEDISEQALPKNLCPAAKECYSLCEDGTLAEADLLLAESSCDGKKKMYELLSRQEQLYYYQVPQGGERAYAKPLIESECRHLIRMLRQRFGADVTPEALRAACESLNAERQSVMDLLAVQRQTPPAAWGGELLAALEENRAIPDRAARTEANRAARERFLARRSPVPERAPRILVTGCPISGVYRKVLELVKQSGGVAVCFENCEGVKAHRRRVDTAAEDLIGAIADCYLETPCAIMSPNSRRFSLIEALAEEYRADGVLDLTLQTCHTYNVERDKLRRFCAQRDIPYFSVETDYSDADAGQLATRIGAFVELL